MPKRLDPKPKWKFRLSNLGVGGVAANEDFVIVSSRDSADKMDQFYCLDFETGLEVWKHQYPAKGDLDYGNSPRATPLMSDPHLFTLGAMGDLICFELETGKVVWKKNLVRDLNGKLPIWGYAASPILIDGNLIVQPGGPKNSVVALDPSTGQVKWSTPGRPAAYASPIHVSIANRSQFVGFDFETLGGWDPSSGQRLWEVKPKVDSDFNVPSPVAVGGGIVLMSENNATRFHSWNKQGILEQEEKATFEEMGADSHTPIQLGKYLIGIHTQLYVLSLEDNLKCVGRFEDPSFGPYSSLIGFANRLLATGSEGEILLLELEEGKPKLLGRFKTQPQKSQQLSHPALVGRTFLIRGADSLDAWDLSEE